MPGFHVGGHIFSSIFSNMNDVEIHYMYNTTLVLCRSTVAKRIYKSTRSLKIASCLCMSPLLRMLIGISVHGYLKVAVFIKFDYFAANLVGWLFKDNEVVPIWHGFNEKWPSVLLVQMAPHNVSK